jgi:hypothetical protein
MDEKIKKDGEEKNEVDAVNIKDYYQDKEIFRFFNNLIDINIKKVISILNNYIECGDWKSSIILIDKVLQNSIFKYANEKYKTKFIDILIKKLLPNIFIYLDSEVDEIFEFLYYILKYVNNY